MPKICPRYAQDMPEICPRYAQDMPEICPRYAQDMPKIFPRYAQYMPKICPRYAQDMPKFSPRYSQDMPKICTWCMYNAYSYDLPWPWCICGYDAHVRKPDECMYTCLMHKSMRLIFFVTDQQTNQRWMMHACIYRSVSFVSMMHVSIIFNLWP